MTGDIADLGKEDSSTLRDASLFLVFVRYGVSSTADYHVPREHYPINSETSNRVTVIKNNSTRTGVLGG